MQTHLTSVCGVWQVSAPFLRKSCFDPIWQMKVSEKEQTTVVLGADSETHLDPSQPSPPLPARSLLPQDWRCQPPIVQTYVVLLSCKRILCVFKILATMLQHFSLCFTKPQAPRLETSGTHTRSHGEPWHSLEQNPQPWRH